MRRYNRNQLRPRSRCGTSIVEMVVVIAVTALVLTLAIVTLLKFMDMSHVVQRHLHRHVVLSRLAEQFRGDVWGANQVDEPAGRAKTLTLVGAGDFRIRYEIDGRRLQRTLFSGEEIRGRDDFELPGLAPSTFEVTDDSSGVSNGASTHRIGLLLTPMLEKTAETGAESPPEKRLRISAMIGRDARLAGSEEDR
jgi:hypothetical protein